MIKNNPGTRILDYLDDRITEIKFTLNDGINSQFDGYIEKLREVTHSNMCAVYHEVGSEKRASKSFYEFIIKGWLI